MAKWREYVKTEVVQAHRTGWQGAWDAIRAAWTGKARVTVNTPITMSIWARISGDEKIELRLTQAETKEADHA